MLNFGRGYEMAFCRTMLVIVPVYLRAPRLEERIT